MLNFSILYIGLVQLGFSALDIYARSSLRGADSFYAGMSQEWFVVWLVLQILISPFQIRLIVQNGLGKGVALMNGFSVLFALTGGYVFLSEPVHWNQLIAVALVLIAVWLFATPTRSTEVSPSSPIDLKETSYVTPSNHEVCTARETPVVAVLDVERKLRGRRTSESVDRAYQSTKRKRHRRK